MPANRYDAAGAEAEVEPGSKGRVLRNRLGIRLVREMAMVESQRLYQVTQRLIDETTQDQRFTVADLCRMHNLWLGDVYTWAGQFRSVNIVKGDFMFAAAEQVPRLMDFLERDLLQKFTPCRFESMEDCAHALAVVHAELILIHPFREGNGRCARLLSTLMALQAGLPPLDYSEMEGRFKPRYIAAIHASVAGDYRAMMKIFAGLIGRSR